MRIAWLQAASAAVAAAAAAPVSAVSTKELLNALKKLQQVQRAQVGRAVAPAGRKAPATAVTEVDEKSIERFLKSIDVDGDGKISIDEATRVRLMTSFLFCTNFYCLIL